MKFKIGVFGSANNDHAKDIVAKARELGKELAKLGCTIITGACGGLPYAVAESAARNGAELWGFSPAVSRDEHVGLYPEQDVTIYKKLFWVPKEIATYGDAVSRKYRNVVSTSHCDVGIIISGKWGTMHEFCSLYDYGKVIGVLTGTGGIADELHGLCKKINKETGAKVFFEHKPVNLVQRILAELTQRNHPLAIASD